MTTKALAVLGILVTCLLSFGCRPHSEWSELFMKKGIEYASKGDHDAALQEYSKAIQMHEKNDEVRLHMADSYHALKKYNFAVEQINLLDSMDYPVPAAYDFLRGESLLHYEAASVAIRNGYTLAIGKDPLNGLFYYRRAQAYEIAVEETVNEGRAKYYKGLAQRDYAFALQYGYSPTS